MSLHYGKLSSRARRVTMTAAILGIEIDHHHVDLRDREARRGLARLTHGKVPVLEDGDFVQAWLARVQALPAGAQTEPPPTG